MKKCANDKLYDCKDNLCFNNVHTDGKCYCMNGYLNSIADCGFSVLSGVDKIQIKPRDTCKWFSKMCEKKLSENDKKEHWEKNTPTYLFHRLVQEVAELSEELNSFGQSENIIKECADVANFAMMIASIHSIKINNIRGRKEE